MLNKKLLSKIILILVIGNSINFGAADDDGSTRAAAEEAPVPAAPKTPAHVTNPSTPIDTNGYTKNQKVAIVVTALGIGALLVRACPFVKSILSPFSDYANSYIQRMYQNPVLSQIMQQKMAYWMAIITQKSKFICDIPSCFFKYVPAVFKYVECYAPPKSDIAITMAMMSIIKSDIAIKMAMSIILSQKDINSELYSQIQNLKKKLATKTNPREPEAAKSAPHCSTN